MFEPGQKVVCVNGRFDNMVKPYYPELPQEGEVYTVRDVVGGTTDGKSETCAVYLREINATKNDFGIERGFHYTRFVPMEELTESHKVITKEKEPALV